MVNKEYIAAVGRSGRILAAKIGSGNDVVNSIVELIKEHGFKSGTFTAIGSLNSATVIWARSTDMTLSPQKNSIFYTMEGPVELGIGWGMFGTDEEGEVYIHFHGIVMDKDGNMRCGNLEPGSAPVMATVDLTIQELIDLQIKPTFNPIRKNKRLIPTNLP